MFSKRYLSILWIFVLVLSLGSVSCGGSSGSSDDDGDDDGETTTDLTGTFPSDLVLVSPTAARSDAWTSANAAALTRDDVLPFTEQATLQGILEGTETSDCSFSLSIVPNYANALCFGPSITYTNHSDTDPPTATGVIGGGDLGIMYSTVYDSPTEACAAGQMNGRIDAIGAQVNSVIYAMASLPCLAAVNDLSLPAAGETLDLTSVVSSGFTSNSIAFTVTSASLARAADTADGYAVYILTLSGVATDEDATEHQVNIRLKHVATATDNSTYRGKLSYTIDWEEASVDLHGNCDDFGDTTGAVDAVSIEYEKTTTTAMTVQVKGAGFCGSEADPYESATNYSVDLTRHIAADDLTGYGGSANYALFSYNPENGAGDFVFGWQAGYSDNARILEATVDEDGGALTGCGYFGYGLTFSAYDYASTLPDIDGMYCAWSGPGATHTLQDLAQRQCFSYDITTNLFEVDASVGAEAITFAPTNSCNATADNFTYTDGTTNIDYDGATDGDIANNLISVDDIDIGAITAPTDVDE